MISGSKTAHAIPPGVRGALPWQQGVRCWWSHTNTAKRSSNRNETVSPQITPLTTPPTSPKQLVPTALWTRPDSDMPLFSLSLFLTEAGAGAGAALQLEQQPQVEQSRHQGEGPHCQGVWLQFEQQHPLLPSLSAVPGDAQSAAEVRGKPWQSMLE